MLSKEQFDEKLIDSSLQIISKNDVSAIKPHIIYTGDYYFIDREEKLRSLILKGMKKYKIKSVMVTRISLVINGLIMKEDMENYYNGKKKQKESINDDLDAFFHNLKLGKDAVEKAETYHLPKLTEEELEFIERGSPGYLRNFLNKNNFHFAGTEMVLIESDSIWLEGWFFRRTYTIRRTYSTLTN